jgi:hypothetical protein
MIAMSHSDWERQVILSPDHRLVRPVIDGIRAYLFRVGDGSMNLFTTATFVIVGIRVHFISSHGVKLGYVCEAWYIVGNEDLGGSLKHFWQGHNNREGYHK